MTASGEKIIFQIKNFQKKWRRIYRLITQILITTPKYGSFGIFFRTRMLFGTLLENDFFNCKNILKFKFIFLLLFLCCAVCFALGCCFFVLLFWFCNASTSMLDGISLIENFILIQSLQKGPNFRLTNCVCFLRLKYWFEELELFENNLNFLYIEI